jgi:hypothetical protein
VDVAVPAAVGAALVAAEEVGAVAAEVWTVAAEVCGVVAAEIWPVAEEVVGVAGEVEVAAPQAVAVRQAAARSAWRIYLFLRTSPQQRL